jgi:hypothetical protein
MHFMFRNYWSCSFMEPDLKTHLKKKLTFRDAEKIRQIVERVGNFADLQERQALDYAIQIGRGGVWLQLTTEQYERLKSEG